MNINTVSNQWVSRPNDQRFLSVDQLYAKVLARRGTSTESSIALDVCQVNPTDAGEIEIIDTRGQSFGELTHYSFGQLCARAGAPAGYLRTLPAQLATIPLQWSLETREKSANESNDVKLLTRVNGRTNIAAVTSPSYGRIWDEQVVGAIKDHIDPTVWKVPSARYSSTDPLRATTLYASDRDVFIFLVNESAGIDVDGASIKRGVYVWNSEVGSATFGIATFLYDYVCDNRIIWGAKEFREIKIRHTSGGPHRFVAQAVPELQAYAASSAGVIESTIRRAKAHEVANDRAGVTEWLKARKFTSHQAKMAYEKAEQDPRNYNPRSVWGLVQGLTDAAHDIKNTDDRTDVEKRAGSLLDLV
jgi:hypothetical protein